MKYDIFISYRREGGYDTAKHLNDLLVRDGYKVSFDIDTLRNGDFDTQLLERINQCKDFILIVDQHAFDRTLDPNFNPKNDWMRCELAYALKKNKNIIPVFLSGVTQFPANLPEDIADIIKKNGPEYNRYYFNDFYKVLKSRFLHKKGNYRLITSTLLSLIVLATTLFLFYNSCSHTEKKDTTDNKINIEEQADSSYETESQKDITTYEIELLTVINTFVQAYEQSESHNIYWDVFAQKPLTPLSRSYDKAPKESHYPNVLKFKGKLQYSGKPLTTYDSGQAADWIVSLYGANAGPTMMRIDPDEEGGFGDEELILTAKSIVQKAGFAYVRKKGGYVDESYLYKKGDLLCLICTSSGSAGSSIDMMITADKKEIDNNDWNSK